MCIASNQLLYFPFNRSLLFPMTLYYNLSRSSLGHRSISKPGVPDRGPFSSSEEVRAVRERAAVMLCNPRSKWWPRGLLEVVGERWVPGSENNGTSDSDA